MFWKKNVFSYVLWIVFAGITVSGLYGLIANLTGAFKMPMYGNLLIAVAYCLVAYAVMLFARNLIEDKFYKVHIEEKTLRIIELCGFALCILLGIVFRLIDLDGKITDTYYFQNAKTGDNAGVPYFVHGAGYVYALMLRAVCSVFGNDIVNGVILQSVFLLIACICFYFAVRMISGRMPAFMVLLVGLCATYIRKDTLTLSPTALIILMIAVSSLLIAIVVKNEAATGWYFPIGLLIGLFGYLDSLCFLPLFFLLGVILRDDDESGEEWQDRLLRLLAAVVMAVLGFGIMLYCDMVVSGCTLERLLWAYSYANGNGDSSVMSMTLECKYAVEMTIFFAVLILAAVAFLHDKHKERILGWSLPLLVLLVVQALGVGNRNVDINVILMLYGAVLGGIGISAFWVFERLPVRQTQFIMENDEWNEKETEEEKIEFVKPSEDIGEVNDDRERYSLKVDLPEGVSADEIEFIENPLPLPKKHVSKNMDYDIDVPDDDDFDI